MYGNFVPGKKKINRKISPDTTDEWNAEFVVAWWQHISISSNICASNTLDFVRQHSHFILIFPIEVIILTWTLRRLLILVRCASFKIISTIPSTTLIFIACVCVCINPMFVLVYMCAQRIVVVIGYWSNAFLECECERAMGLHCY